jgi:Flp pilus assembly protein TadG
VKTNQTLKAGDRGSSSLFFAALTASLLLVVGLVVDGAGMIKATQQADQLAQQAARAAGQELTADAMTGDPVTLDKGPARVAAEKYLTHAGATGTVTVSGTKITVEVHTDYHPKFLSMIGVGNLDAEGHAQVDSIRVLNGKER